MPKFPAEISITKHKGVIKLVFDGEEFPWFTCDGYQLHVKKDLNPAVTITIPADRILVHDEI